MNKYQTIKNYNDFLTEKTGFDPEILEYCLKEYLEKNNKPYQLFTDGASSGNPGPAGAGILIKHEQELLFQTSYSLGNATNNEAEYWALILGLYQLRKIETNTAVYHITDSELLARQLQGIYKVKNERLQILWKAVQNLIKLFNRYEVQSLPRVQLTEVDDLAKKGCYSGNTELFQEIKKELIAEGFLEERA